MTTTPHLEMLETLSLFLLVLVVVFAALAQRIKVPYPILLVLAGLGISFLPRVPRVPLSPDLVFLILLPPLLYVSAWQTNLREFKRNIVAISSLAVGLVGFTVVAVAAFADHFITALDWKSGLLLGAVAAATDAIAATAIAKSIGLPQRIVDLLEGESLVNDATSLLALEFGLQLLLRGESPSLGAALLRLLWLISGGALIGVGIGFVVAWIERWINDGPMEMAISIIVPYTAYLAAERVHASGVIAVVACGLLLSRRSVAFFSPETRIQVLSAWNALNFTLNGFVFVLVGLQLPYVLSGLGAYSHRTLLFYGLIFTAVLIVLRLIWVFPALALAPRIQGLLSRKQCDSYSAKSMFVVGWTGMRGVVSLAAALSLPETLGDGRPFAQRNLIIFITFTIIFLTLVAQGLSLPALIRALGLSGQYAEGPATEERQARRIVLDRAIRHLERGREASSNAVDSHAFDDLLHLYRHRLESLTEHAEEQPDSHVLTSRRNLILEVTQIERATLIELRDQGTIGDDTLRILEHELDLTEVRPG